MANYASLWTSGFDKEFRQMSKFHSLQRRRLGLQMAGIQQEHARHVKRVRVEIREAGTLTQQYEDEKEQRARHLLHTFSMVQRKRQASQGWRAAHQRRLSSVAPGSSTFDVEIGQEDAPWRGGRRRGSQLSDLSSRRRSSTSSFNSFNIMTPRPSLGNALGKKTVTLSPDLPRRHTGGLPRSASKKLPPLGPRGGTYPQTQKGFSGFLNSWRTAVQGSRGNEQEDDEDPVEDEEDCDQEEQLALSHKGRRKGSVTKRDWGQRPSGKRQIFWTETFPYVYHSVGETVCPRYKLFLQADEYQVEPQPKTRGGKRTSVTSTTSSVSQYAPTPRHQADHQGRPSFRTLGKSVSMVGSSTACPRPLGYHCLMTMLTDT